MFNNPGIAVTTYSSQTTSDERYQVIEDCFKHLNSQIPKEIPIFVINDGSNESRLLLLLKKFKSRFHIINRSQNGGISRAKNTAIKAMYDFGCDLMFLMDDDLNVKRDFINFYQKAIEVTKIQHFNYMVRKLHTESWKDIHINSISLHKSPQLNGCFMTLTREMVEVIGYFKILPHRYGHEHTEFTLRAIEAGFSRRFVDVKGSDEYLEFHPLAYTHQSEPLLNSDLKKIQENSRVAFESPNSYIPFED